MILNTTNLTLKSSKPLSKSYSQYLVKTEGNEVETGKFQVNLEYNNNNVIVNNKMLLDKNVGINESSDNLPIIL